ncbi:hypothetical protein CC1G_11998 [Coprinopsis cinerea okayama7|uniref:Uncharacterized protein n=1 Tax=Coprinopsis cinerea (strain Okayama-7 / 130 / ATCC MYA-4618 / FGSC 9003) TaxID=240176 RepID=A8N0Z3_COPC7|nr:hypothetical protein CC1G_11998 [Coprinopsis cinerea okayama7\|eukprot:XP_001828550.1 hypothetical protein CC1G_11998 [Coprinopsis cinerea okayama7\
MLLNTSPALQGLTALESQTLLDYASSRLRHCAETLTGRSESIKKTPGLFESCWNQLKIDIRSANTTLILQSIVNITHPDVITPPSFLVKITRLLVSGGIDSLQDVASAARDRQPPLRDHFRPTICLWWCNFKTLSPITPVSLSVRDVVDAFRGETPQAWLTYTYPMMLLKGCDVSSLAPLSETFSVVEERMTTAETELRSALEAIDFFRVKCSSLKPLLAVRLEDPSAWVPYERPSQSSQCELLPPRDETIVYSHEEDSEWVPPPPSPPGWGRSSDSAWDAVVPHLRWPSPSHTWECEEKSGSPTRKDAEDGMEGMVEEFRGLET